MSKIHLVKNGKILCGSKSFGPTPGDGLVMMDDSGDITFTRVAMPEDCRPYELSTSTDIEKVTCKLCIKMNSL